MQRRGGSVRYTGFNKKGGTYGHLSNVVKTEKRDDRQKKVAYRVLDAGNRFPMVCPLGSADMVVVVKYVIGIDPGTNHAGIAAVGMDAPLSLLCNRPLSKKDMRCTAKIRRMVNSCIPHDCVSGAIEGQFLGLNVNSLIKLCRNAGRWQEALDVHSIPVEWVPPKTWIVRTLGRGLNSEQVKKISIQTVKQLYGVTVTEHEAAAIMIARYHATELMRKGIQRG